MHDNHEMPLMVMAAIWLCGWAVGAAGAAGALLLAGLWRVLRRRT